MIDHRQPAAGEPAAPPRRTILAEAVLVALAVAAVYLATLAGSHNEGEDGVGYLLPIRDGDVAGIFNPYHLIYNWLGWTADHTARSVGFGGGPMGPMQILDALLGAAGIGLLWVLLRTVTGGRTAAFGACGIVAFSYGYWGYSVDVEVYVLSTVLLIAALFAAWHASTHPSPRAFAVLGVAHGFAVLGHNTNVLFGVVALAALAITWRAISPSDRWRCIAAYAAGGVAVVVPLYALAIPVVGLHSPREFYDWLTAYAQSGDWGHLTAQSGPKAAIGAGRALIGGHSALSLGPIHDFADRRFHDKSLREEFFMVRNFSHPLAWALVAVTAMAGAAMVISLARWIQRPAVSPAARRLAVLCLAWLVPYAIFFTWWEPANLEFWISTMVPVGILAALPGSAPTPGRGPRMPALVLFLAVACLFTVNLLGSVGPQRRERDDYWRVRADWYEQHTQAGDLVLANGYIFSEYLRYFGEGTVVDVNNDVIGAVGEQAALADVERRIDEAPGRVLISSEALFPGDDAYSHCSEPMCRFSAVLRDALLPRADVVSDEPLEKVWELRRER